MCDYYVISQNRDDNLFLITVSVWFWTSVSDFFHTYNAFNLAVVNPILLFDVCI